MMARTFEYRIRFAVACMALALLAGCQRAQVAQPLTQDMAGDDPDTQMAFWHTLEQRRLTSNDEAFHALLLFLDGSDKAADYAGRVEALRSRGYLPRSFARPANEGVTRGTVALVLTHALCVKGGVMMSLFGDSERYAVRELMDKGIYPTSSPFQTFSGDEFIEIIGRAEDYERQSNIRAPAAQVNIAATESAKTSADEAAATQPAQTQPATP
ncbi:MAG: hypothetical protein IT440_10665 [Phycisphaeraceae bacterium]|nr:hypothetical protein [Phycisphaeraceae bacterium]